MGLKCSTTYRTPCEIVREINDLIQADNALNRLIRSKLIEIEKGAKLMSDEVEKHDKGWNIRTWRKPNTNEPEDWKRRLKPDYKTK